MGALLRLGIALTRSGGPFRIGSVAIGCALAVALLTLAWELPDAMFPVPEDPTATNPLRGPVASLLLLVTAPVVALLLAVGRMSSEVRDRRLGSLMMLGVSRRRVLLVAAAENLLPAVVGAIAGIGVFALLRAALTAMRGDLLVEPIGWSPRLTLVAVGVVTLSALLAIAPIRRLSNARTGVSEAAAEKLSLWRLTPVPIAVVLLIAVLATPPERVTDRTAVAMIGAALAAALSVALATPLFVAWFAARLTRGRTVSTTLASRGIQTQGTAIARRVTALGVTTFVALAAVGYLQLYGSDPSTASAIHQVEHGPQEIWVDSSDGVAPLDSDLPERLNEIPGVQGAWFTWSLSLSDCDESQGSCPRVFVGACDELTLLATVSGCTDDRAAWIQHTAIPTRLSDQGWAGIPWDGSPDAELNIAGTSEEMLLPVTGSITQDVEATTERWLSPSPYDLFIPSWLAQEHGVPKAVRLTVIADAGAQIRAEIVATVTAAGAWTFSPAMWEYQRIVTVRTTVWGVAAASIAVALLVFSLTSIDRARAQRRGRARLVAVGVPARVLRRAQALSNGIPLGVSLAIALGFAWAALMTLAHLVDDAGPAFDWGQLAAVTAAIAAGAAVVALLTMPLTRGTIRADDLRQE